MFLKPFDVFEIYPGFRVIKNPLNQRLKGFESYPTRIRTLTNSTKNWGATITLWDNAVLRVQIYKKK